MNELELKKLWQTTNDKLEESFVINKKNLNKIYSVEVSMCPTIRKGVVGVMN